MSSQRPLLGLNGRNLRPRVPRSKRTNLGLIPGNLGLIPKTTDTSTLPHCLRAASEEEWTRERQDTEEESAKK